MNKTLYYCNQCGQDVTRGKVFCPSNKPCRVKYCELIASRMEYFTIRHRYDNQGNLYFIVAPLVHGTIHPETRKHLRTLELPGIYGNILYGSNGIAMFNEM